MALIYRVEEGFDFSLLSGASCAFGVFDGVHLGHRFIVDEARKTASASSAKAMILTFDIDPDEVFRPGEVKKLMTNAQRLEALAELDVDGVVVFRFTREFASQNPHQFASSVFCGHVPAYIHVGSDFRFGAKASGTVDDLAAFGAPYGMKTVGHDLFIAQGSAVTATRIRSLLAAGEISRANELLGRPYRVEGVVREGRKQGRDMGFRTANLHVPEDMRALSDGVYAAYAHVGEKRFKAAVSVGVAPTFSDEASANMEAHILDFEGDLYGRSIAIEFIAWLRPMMEFPDLQTLIDTVKGNIDWVRSNL